jgi:SUKH-3 immunity protein
MQSRLEPPESVRELFLSAGWPVAKRTVDRSVPEGHPAAVLLEQFGGLNVGNCDGGEECASSDIAFGHAHEYQGDATVLEWERLLSTTLVNIGEVHHSHGALFVDESGAWYGMSFIHDAFWFEGGSFEEAVERILLGRKSKAMLRPDQASVSLYGVEIGAGHPDVHDWRHAAWEPGQ